VITNPAVIAYNKNLVPKAARSQELGRLLRSFFKGNWQYWWGEPSGNLWSAFGEKWGLDFTKKL